MASFTFKPKFNVGENVFLNVVGSEEQIITDIMFQVSTKLIKYEVMDNAGVKGWFRQIELTRERIIK